MGRDLGLERDWRNRMRQYDRSGLTVREFCEQEDLVVHQFHWWRSELKRRQAKSVRKRKPPRQSTRTKRGPRRSSAAAGKFVPVQVQPNPRPGAPIEIVVEQPLRVAVSSGFDPDLLADVIRALEGRPC